MHQCSYVAERTHGILQPAHILPRSGGHASLAESNKLQQEFEQLNASSVIKRKVLGQLSSAMG
jgi:hypothetical protein